MSDAPRWIASTRILLTTRTTGASSDCTSRLPASISSSSDISSRSSAAAPPSASAAAASAAISAPKSSIRRSSYDLAIASRSANSLARTGSTSQPVRKRMSSSATTFVGSDIARVRTFPALWTGKT